MKRIFVEPNPELVDLRNLTGNEIIAYRSNSDNNNYCILSKLNSNGFRNKNLHRNYDAIYGFVPLNTSNSNPRFCNNSWQGAIQQAVNSKRNVMVFNSQDELLRAILNREF